MSQDDSQPVVIEPAEPARATVIWLHGLGADGNDFVGAVPWLGLDQAPIRFVFPHAPVRPVTVNGGMVMRAWYDIYSLTDLEREDTVGLQDSAARIEGLIVAEASAGVSHERIVVAGFSQGGAVALHMLHAGYAMAGAVGLSCYLPQGDAAGPLSADRLPVFLAHGRNDSVVPFRLGERARDALQDQGYPVTWQVHGGDHEVTAEELTALGHWLREVLGL